MKGQHSTRWLAGRYLLFASNRPGGRGRGDRYLSIAAEDGSWSEPIAFDDTINTPGQELCPAVSLGGALLYGAATEAQALTNA